MIREGFDVMEEIWKDIEDYEGLYQVSNMGKVKSLNYHMTGKERILKPGKNKDGYLIVCLCKNSELKTFLVHRLVATAFIPNPNNKPHIDHINTIRDDNRVENLKWATVKENNDNVLTMAKRNTRVVLQFNKEGIFIRKWNCVMDVQRELGFSNSHISECCSGKLETAYNYKWKYA